MTGEKKRVAAWREILREGDQPWAMTEIARRVKMSREAMAAFAKLLEAEGYIRRAPEPILFRDLPMVTFMTVVAPRELPVGLIGKQRELEIARENMWRAFRINKSISPQELAAVSTGRGVVVTERAASEYLTALHNAGYARRYGKSPALYRLVIDPGPKAPIFRRVAELFDPNADRVVMRDGERVAP